MDLIQGYESGEEQVDRINQPKRARDEERHPQPSQVIQEPPAKKQKLLEETLELPKFIYDDEQEKQKEEETRQQHQGRKRTFPHVAGNWPTSVFIPLQLNLGTNMPNISRSIQSIRHRLLEDFKLRQFVDSNTANRIMEQIEDVELHISLSRTFPLREHEFGLFVENLQRSLRNLNAPSFDVDLDEMEWYLSDDASRSFVSLNVADGVDKNAVCALIGAVDEAVEVVGKPKFYEDPKPHVSISWCLGNAIGDLKSCNLPLKAPLLNEEKLTIPVKTILCKIGHRLFPFHLS